MSKREITDTIVIHCTQTPPTMDIDVTKVTEWHKQRGFDTIGYHFLIKRLTYQDFSTINFLFYGVISFRKTRKLYRRSSSNAVL